MTTPRGDGRPADWLPPDLEQALETGPFDRALQLAITHRGLKLAAIERRLVAQNTPVARSTLSYWQQGRRQPERESSRRALTALEEILNLPSLSLVNLVGAPKPRGRWIGYRRGGLQWSEMWDDGEAVEQVLTSDSRRESGKVEDISLYESFSIGAHRERRWKFTQVLTRALEDGADRAIVLYGADVDVDVRDVKLKAVSNCRAGRVRYLPESRLAAFEVLLGRSMRVGETHLYAYRLDYAESASAAPASSSDASGNVTGRIFRDPVHLYVMQAEFHPETLPVSCSWVQRARQSAEERTVAELSLTAQNTAHFSLESSPPGAHAIRWEWA
jgi:hypothetical protein